MTDIDAGGQGGQGGEGGQLEPRSTEEAASVATDVIADERTVDKYYNDIDNVAIDRVEPDTKTTLAAALTLAKGPPAEGEEGEAAKAKSEPRQDAGDGIPEHFSEGDKAILASQSPEAREWLLGQNKKMIAAHTQRSQEIAPLRAVTDDWQPYLDQVAEAQGVESIPAAEAITGLLQTERAMRTASPEDKRAMLEHLAEQYGAAPLDAMPQGWREGDPAVAQQQYQEAAPEQANEFVQAQAVYAAQAHVDQFKAATNDDGSLRFPFFAQVEHEMTRLAHADQMHGVTPDIQNLYERATWGDPNLRQRALTDRDAQAEAERKTSERDKIAKARSASVSISGGGGQRAEDPGGSTEDILRTHLGGI